MIYGLPISGTRWEKQTCKPAKQHYSQSNSCKLHYSWYSEGTLIKNSENEIVVLNGEYQYNINENPGNKIIVRAEAAPGLTHIHHAINGKKIYMVKAAVEETFQRNDTIYGNCFFYDAVDDASGNMWIGSSKGLVKFNTLQNQLVHYQHDENNTNSVSSDFIYSLEIDDSNETIWMAAYNGGLCSYRISIRNIPTLQQRRWPGG